MQPSSVPTTPSLRRSRRRAGSACGVVTVLLITASMQLARDRLPRLGRSSPAPRRTGHGRRAATDRAARHGAGGPGPRCGAGRAVRSCVAGQRRRVRAGGARRRLARGRPRRPGQRGHRDPRRTPRPLPREHRGGWAHLVVAPRAGTPMDTRLRGHLLRQPAGHVGVERPGARARGGPRAAHVRPRRPGCAIGRRRRPPPGRGAGPRACWPALRLRVEGERRPQPLPAHDPGRHRAHVPHPVRHRSPRGSSRSAPTGMHSAFWMLPQDSAVLQRRPRPGQPRSTSWSSSGDTRPRRGDHRLVRRPGYGPGWSSVSLGGKFSDARRALGTRPGVVAGVPRVLGRVDAGGVRLPRRRSRVLPREPGGVPRAGRTSCCRCWPRTTSSTTSAPATSTTRPRWTGSRSTRARPPRHGRRHHRPPT